MLWGIAAGRCEFAGCNERLVEITRYAGTGERSREGTYLFVSEWRSSWKSGIAPGDLNDLKNLMLVCHGCHRKIDQTRDGGRYSVRLLQQMKAAHEQRIGSSFRHFARED